MSHAWVLPVCVKGSGTCACGVRLNGTCACGVRLNGTCTGGEGLDNNCTSSVGLDGVGLDEKFEILIVVAYNIEVERFEKQFARSL